MAARSSNNKRTLALVVVLALAAVGAWFLKDFGFYGDGVGPGGESEPQMPDIPEGEAVRLVVQGERCLPAVGRLEGCETACQRLLGGAGQTQVVIDAQAGEHGTVEALRECLEEGGIQSIRVLAAPPP